MLDKNKIVNYSIDLIGSKSLVNYEADDDDDDDDEEENLNEPKIVVKDLNWSNFRSVLSNSFPKLDILIGSDVFFDTKRKNQYLLNFKIVFFLIKNNLALKISKISSQMLLF